MQNQKVVAACLVAVGILLWFILTALFETGFIYFDLDYGFLKILPVAAPILIAGGTVFVLIKSSVVTTFLSEVVVELKKVVWPSKKDTWAATFVVIIFVAIISAVLGLVDLGWAYLVNKFILG